MPDAELALAVAAAPLLLHGDAVEVLPDAVARVPADALLVVTTTWTEHDFSDLAQQHTLGDDPVPAAVTAFAAGRAADLVWRNDLGGLAFRIDDVFMKWNPRRTGVDLERERVRLEWLAERHPAPRVLLAGQDDEAQWLVTAALPGGSAVGDTWRARRSEAIRAIATGLRAIHAIPVDDVPPSWTSQVWVGRAPSSIGSRPAVDRPVLVHGDACAPNTLIGADGLWTGNVDFGDLTVGDRWADLAIASLSLDWNFGEGHQPELFDAYGVAPDAERIRYYRELWHLES
jgi:kanamycin kinase